MTEPIFKTFQLSQLLELKRETAAQILGEDERVVMRLAYHFGWVTFVRAYKAFETGLPMAVKIEFARFISEEVEEASSTISRCNMAPAHAHLLEHISGILKIPEGQVIRLVIELGFDALAEAWDVPFTWKTSELVRLVNLDRATERKMRRTKLMKSLPSKPIFKRKKRPLKKR